MAKAVHAFQTTDEYNTILFRWYFKVFELLRRYLIKHGLGTDLEDLDFKSVDKRSRQTRWPKQPRLLQPLARILPRLRRMEMMFPHPDSTAFFFFGNDLFVLGLLDTFFICRCPLVFRLLNNFQPYIYIYIYIYAFIFIHLVC